MDLHFDKFADRVRYALRDFTSVGSKTSFNIPVLDDEKLYRMNPQRYSFYMQLLDALQDPKSEVLDRILQVESKTRLAREQMEERLADMGKNLRYLQTQYRKTGKKTIAENEVNAASKLGGAGGAFDADAIKKQADDVMKPVYAIRDELEKIQQRLEDINKDIELGYDARKEAIAKVKQTYENDFLSKYSEASIEDVLITALTGLQSLQRDITTQEDTINTNKGNLIKTIFEEGIKTVSKDVISDDGKIVIPDVPSSADLKSTELATNVEKRRVLEKTLVEKINETKDLDDKLTKASEQLKQAKAAAKKAEAAAAAKKAEAAAAAKTAAAEKAEAAEEKAAAAESAATAEAEAAAEEAAAKEAEKEAQKLVQNIVTKQQNLAIYKLVLEQLRRFNEELQASEASLEKLNDAKLYIQTHIFTVSPLSADKADYMTKLDVELTGDVTPSSPGIKATFPLTVTVDNGGDGTLKIDGSKTVSLSVELTEANLASANGSTHIMLSKTGKGTPDSLMVKLSFGDSTSRDHTLHIETVANISIPVQVTPLHVGFTEMEHDITGNVKTPSGGIKIINGGKVRLTFQGATKNIKKIIDDIKGFIEGKTEPKNFKNNLPKLTEGDVVRISDNELAADFQNEVNPQIDMFKKEVIPAPFMGGAMLASGLVDGMLGGAAEEGSYYQRKLDELDSIEKTERSSRDRKLAVGDVLDEIETHPIYNVRFEKVSLTDRIIFVAMTFIIRGLALFLIDWGLNSHMINSFNRAFLMYMIIYMCIFLVWVLLVNAGEDGKNMFFRMLFYYVNSEVHGHGRILIHLIVQLMLLPIPFIVKDRVVGKNPTWTYEQRRATYRVLSNFTFFIWILTSLIALRY